MLQEIREPEFLVKLGEWRSSGLSWSEIADKASKMIGKPVSAHTVKEAYMVAATRNAEIIRGDEVLKGKLSKVVFNQAEQLEKINRVCNELLDVLNEHKSDPIALLSAMREIREQIKLQNELLNVMSEGFNARKFSEVEYAKHTAKNLEELERMGYIKILHRPNEAFNNKVINVITLTEKDMEELIMNKVININGYSIQVVKEENK